MTPPYHPPVKRSLAIQGHRSSVSLEPLFWALLKTAAAREGTSAAALVARIDGERIKADPAPGLAGAIRVWLVTDLIAEQQKGAERSAPAPSAEDRSTGQ
jgi:predicted DNA-binding ribbon-helix-helix protein